MKLAQTTETFSRSEDQKWLGSAHGTVEADSITLDVSAFSAVTFPNGFIPSGVVLGKITASGKYGPYDNGASDGTETAVGHLFTTIEAEGIGSSTVDVSGALYWHGEVVEANLPTGHGLDANGKTDLKHIRYV
jgi:hypothetical protein